MQNEKNNNKINPVVLQPGLSVSPTDEKVVDSIIEQVARTSGMAGISLRNPVKQYGEDVIKDFDSYRKYGFTPSSYVDKDLLDLQRAKNQSRIEQFGRMLGQATVNEVILGTVRGFSDIFDSAISFFKGAEFDDYSNPVSKELEDLQNQVRENWAIYQEENDGGFHMGDFGWWMNGTVSAATTLSLMLPGLGITKGVSLLGKIPLKGITLGGKIDRIGIKAAQAVTGGRGARLYKTIKDGTEVGGMALLSRTAENYQEAREVYNAVLEKSKSELANMSESDRKEFLERNPQYANMKDDDIAANMATVSAGETFRKDFWMLLMDIPQFKSLKPIWKGVGAGRMGSVATTRTVRKANKEVLDKLTKGSLSEEAAAAASKKFSKDAFTNAFRLENIGKNAKDFFTRTEGLMLGEAVEEGFQGIQSEKGKEVGEMYFNPTLVQKTLGDYLSDETIWEQAFWGMFGGLLFQGGAKGFRRLEDNLRAKIKADKLTDNEIKALKAGQDKARVEEIYGRFAKMDDYKRKMQLVNNGFNPYSPMREKTGTVKTNASGEIVYNLIDGKVDAERIKTQLTHDFITDLTLDAVDTGNYDLLKEFVSQKEFGKYFEEVGLENDNLFESQLISEMDEIAKEYQKIYYDVISNSDAYSDYITRGVARSILKREEYIKAINDRQNQIDSQLSEENIDNTDNYYKQALKLAITQKIAAYQKAINELEQRKKDRHDFLSNYSYNYQLKDYARQLNKLYNELQKVDDRFVTIEQKEFSNENLQDVLKEAEALYNEFLVNFGIIKNTTEQISNLPERVQSLLYQKSIYELEKIQNEMYLPNTNNAKQYYQNEYDNQEAMYVELAKSKFGRAWDVISKFVEKSASPYETVQHLLKDDIASDETLSRTERRRLEDALEVLRFGSKDREVFNQSLAFMVQQLEAKRKKETEEREKVNISGEEVNPPQEQTNSNTSSTGETQESPKPKVAQVAPSAVVSEGPDYIPDDELPLPVEGEVDQFVPDEKEIFAQELNEAEQAVLNSYEQFDTIDTDKAEEATRRNIRQNRSIYEQLLKDGIDSEAGTQLLNIIRDDLIAQGLEPSDAQQFALSGLRTYLQIEAFKSRFNEKNAASKILLQLAKLKGYKEGDRNSLYSDEEISQFDKDKTLEELFEIFTNDLIKTEIDEKPVIDLKDLFVKISQLLDKQQYTYENLLSLYRDINQYINNRQADLQNSPYVFVNKNFLNKSQAEFIKTLYDKKTERTAINPFKHFKSTLESDKNETFKQLHPNTNKEEFLLELIKYARDKKVTFKKDKNVIQLLITYDGNNRKFAKEKGKTFELGIIRIVKKNKDNTKLTSEYNGVDLTVQLEEDGSISTSLDEVLNECLNNNELYEPLKHQFIYSNPESFTSKERDDGEPQIDEAKEYKVKLVSEEQIEKFLNNKTIKNFVIQQGINREENENDGQYFSKIVDEIASILFYQFNTKRQSADDNFAQIMSKQGITESLDKFRKKLYEDFIQTNKIQTMLAGKQEIEASLKSDNIGKITFTEEEFFVNGRGFGGKQALSHPFIQLDMTECIDENGNKYQPVANAENTLRGVGILIGENRGAYEFNDESISARNGANVAFITRGTSLSEEYDGRAKKERTEFRDATKNYLNDLFNNYLSKVKDKSLSFIERNKAFDDLYDNFVALFGRKDKLLTGVYAKKSRDVITILKATNTVNEKGETVTVFEQIATIYKYSGVKYDKTKKAYFYNGKEINGEDLQEKFEGNIQLGNLQSDNKVVISKISKTNTENIGKFVDYIISLSEFNTTRFAIQHANEANVDGKHILKRNGKIVIKIGNYYGKEGKGKEFVNFTDAAISLNMFLTTERSAKRQNSYSYEDKNGKTILPTSFYVDIKGVTRPVTEEQNIVDKGLAYWKQTNEIKDRTEVSTDEIITYSGLNDTEKDALRELNTALENQLFADTIILGGNENFKTVDEEGNEVTKESSGRYVKSSGKIILTNRGIQEVTNKPASLIRLLVHENIHRIVDQQGVLKGKIGQQRITEIKDIFNQFLDALQKASDSREKEYLVRKFTAFQQDYGNRDVVFVDEFIAEALTDITLRDFLNKVQSKETVIIERDQTKKTLLQRLLEKIVEIFSSITNVNNNTLLAQLNKALGEQQELNLFNQQEEVAETIETSQTPVEEDVELTPEEKEDEAVIVNESEVKDNGTDIKLSDDDFDFSLYEALDENEIKNNEFNENREVNPFGVMTASDMNSFLMQVPSDQRATMASAVANGEFNYQCQ